MLRPLLALALCACATPSAALDGRPVLTGIDFEGNETLSSSSLRERMATTPTSGVFSKTARYYDGDILAVDLGRIVRWYNQKGFYLARITNVEEVRDDEGRVRLVVHIEEGPRAVVKDVSFGEAPGVTAGEMAEIAKATRLQRGDAFEEDGYERSKVELTRQLNALGFANARVTGGASVAIDEATASIAYELRPGPRYSFGAVVVSGNSAIEAADIIHAAGIHPGDRFSPHALEVAQQRVYGLGTFSGVRVEPEAPEDTSVATVHIKVREAPFRTARLGGGAEIDAGRWVLPLLRAEYLDRNLFGGLKRLELSSTLGYAFVPSVYNPDDSGFVTVTTAQFTMPNVLLPGLDLVTGVDFSRELQSSYSYYEFATRIGPGYRFGRHSIALTLNFSRYFNAEVNGAAINTVGPGDEVGILANDNCIPACTLVYPLLRYTYDSRNDLLEPTSGFFATISFEQSLPPGSFRYLRVEPEGRAYFGLTPSIVLAARAQYGLLFLEGENQDPDASPVTRRFFGGGQVYQRGYSALDQGPKAGGNPNDQNFWTTYAALGGNGAMLLSCELRIRTDSWLNHSAIVLFADASRISAAATLPWEGRLEVAPGVGLRYVTPFGAIRADVAYLLNPLTVVAEGGTVTESGKPPRAVNPTPIGSSCAEASGQCIYQRRWSYHITIGESF